MKAGATAALFLALLATPSRAQTPCEANINGFKIHKVYVIGNQYNGVVWAYKHIGEETCLTPVTDPGNADAILYIHRLWTPEERQQERENEPITVSCLSRGQSTVCDDSSGNEMTVNCAGGVCTSYYGPSFYSAVSGLFDAWLSTRWYESDVMLYTTDYKLLWRSQDQKGDWLGAGWPDKVRLGTNSPVCKCGSRQRSKYKNFRHWASMQCNVVFDPLVSIDIKVLDKQREAEQAQAVKTQMMQNAKDAAAKQKTTPQ